MNIKIKGMKTYNHSSALKVIEKTGLENKLFTQEDLQALVGKFFEKQYRFLTADEFCQICQEDWYHFDTMFSDEHDNDFKHYWSSEEAHQLVIKWYNEMLSCNSPKIEVGTKATVYYYSDSRAATVTYIEYYKNGKKDAAGNPIPKKIGVNLNKTNCEDYFAGNYYIIPMTDPEDLKLAEYYFTLRKGGRWVSEGNTTGDGLRLGIGYWHHFIDPSF